MGRRKLPRDADGNIIRDELTTSSTRQPSVKIPKIESKRREKSEKIVSESPFTRIEFDYQVGRWIDKLIKFHNLKENEMVTATTPIGTRVVVASYQDNIKFYLRTFFAKGDLSHTLHDTGEQFFFSEDVWEVYDSVNDMLRRFRPASLAIHPTRKIKTDTRPELNFTGHRDGTAAQERAERKLERIAAKRVKFEAKAKKLADKEAKKKLKQDKINLRLRKKQIKEEKKQLKLKKIEAKKKKAIKQESITSKFLKIASKAKPHVKSKKKK